MRRKLDKDTLALADELGGTETFGSLTHPELEALASAGRLLRVPNDWAVLIESQPADSAYFILEGTADVRKHGATLVSLGAGRLVGEAALVDHRTRNASVVTTSRVRVVRWSYEDLQQMFTLHPRLEEVFSEQHRLRAS
jgi:CRP/FNR family transcriptional regulator, cyclic AMP receptor protein